MLWILFQNNTKKNNAKAGKFKTNSLFALLLFVLSIILNEVVHMKQEDINLLTLKGYYVMESTITRKPYIDRDFHCFMIEDDETADRMVKTIRDIRKPEKNYYRQSTFCTEFYSLGIKGIHVKTAKKDGFQDVSVKHIDASFPRFYNPEVNGNILLLLETCEKKYLEALKGLPFITPVMIDPRMPKHYPGLHYCYATFESEEQYFLLFSTLQEFEEWSESQRPKIWQPLSVTIRSFGRIRGTNSVLINPLSFSLVLNNKQVDIAASR